MMFRRRREAGGEVIDRDVLRGPARIDSRTKNLIARLQAGDIAVIDHEDIDRVAAESLLQHKPVAVVNASRSTSGRYPNVGPLLLASAGVPLLDDCGPSVMTLSDGAMIVIEDDRLFREDGSELIELAKGRRHTLETVEKALDHAKQGIALEIERFAENTIGYIRQERDVLIEAARLPEVQTDFHGRHVLVVVRGYDYKDDLRALRSYIREMRPLLIAVDGGADALLEFGWKPDMIIGDMDSVTSEAMLCGAELVVHAYPGGAAPGLERLEALGLPCVLYEAMGTSEDIAMLLAFERGAELIVAVGTHANLIEFLDKGRRGMASTFLTRLRVGPILVDAKGVSRLYRGRVRRSDLGLLVIAALATMGIVVALSDPLRLTLGAYWIELENWWFQLQRSLFG
ncbi:MAG TPA: putative cytokinetic ring protein SteA [Actinomycetota bacterium]|nr:putative cytokinetic ring protein SteA [Actinomycetota bacterium]